MIIKKVVPYVDYDITYAQLSQWVTPSLSLVPWSKWTFDNNSLSILFYEILSLSLSLSLSPPPYILYIFMVMPINMEKLHAMSSTLYSPPSSLSKKKPIC